MQELSKDQCLRFMTEILKVVKSTNKHEEVFSRIIDGLKRLYHCQSCAFVMIDPKTEYLRVESSYGISHTFQKSFHGQISTGAIGGLIWNNKPLVIVDSSEVPDLAQEIQLEHPFGSCISVPVVADHRSFGYLYLACDRPRSLQEEDVPLLQACADLAGIAYYKCWLAEENLHLGRVDPETGLEKYLPFQEKLRKEMERAERFQESFAVLICDIDNFKKISRTYGYEASRELLRELGNLIKKSIRSIDAAGRYGFDEFILLLAKQDADQSEQFARTLCQSVEQALFTSRRIQSTMSIGIALYPQNGKTMDDLLLTAKKALFEAQRIGRNTVVRLPSVWYASEAV